MEVCADTDEVRLLTTPLPLPPRGGVERCCCCVGGNTIPLAAADIVGVVPPSPPPPPLPIPPPPLPILPLSEEEHIVVRRERAREEGPLPLTLPLPLAAPLRGGVMEEVACRGGVGLLDCGEGGSGEERRESLCGPRDGGSVGVAGREGGRVPARAIKLGIGGGEGLRAWGGGGGNGGATALVTSTIVAAPAAPPTAPFAFAAVPTCACAPSSAAA